MENIEINVTTRYVVLGPRVEKLYRIFANEPDISCESSEEILDSIARIE